MNSKDDSTSIENYISIFPTRDFAYLFGGGLFVNVLQYILGMSIFLTDKISLSSFGYLSASYFIGLSLYQVSEFLPSILKDKNYTDYPPPYDNQLLFTQFLINNYDKKILIQYERNINLLAVINIIGSCSFFGGILFFMSSIYKVITKAIPFTSTSTYVIIFVLLIYGLYLMSYFAKRIRVKIENDRKVLLANLFLFKK